MSDAQETREGELRAAFAAGMDAAAAIMRTMSVEPSIAIVGGPNALRIVERAILAAAAEQRERVRAK